MRSSDALRALTTAATFLAATYLAPRAEAQLARGFALERLYQSAPGGGWVVMDALDMRGGLGGAVALTTGYAANPLRVSQGSQALAVVSDEAFVDFGFAITWDRLRLYLNLDAPLAIDGDATSAGTHVGGYTFVSPSVGLGSSPDPLTDARVGFDVRLLGGPTSPFRLGLGAQLLIPNGARSCFLPVPGDPPVVPACYETDGTYRGMLRALFAGDIGGFTYAGQLGVHIRPLDDAPVPGSPQGSELLFGAAAGPKIALGRGASAPALIVGPEVFGETAFRSFFGAITTGVEGLVSARVEGTKDDGPQLRVKLGAGGGLDAQFGAPEWRVVFGIELFDHSGDRDRDHVSDAKDACPDTPGVKTSDPKTSGCPRYPPMAP